MAARDGIRRVASILRAPGAAYASEVEAARRAAAAEAVDAGRQMGVFADRIAGLTVAELIELHDETFRRPPLASIGPLAEWLVHAQPDAAGARTALDALAPVLDRLEGERNPYSYALKALCCLLLMRATGASAQPRHGLGV